MSVDAWLLDLDPSDAALGRCCDLLDPAESDRVGRFRLARDRRRFAARRGQLRLLLSRCLGREVESIAFVVNDHGKPALRDGAGLHFNLSHSGDLALCAVSDAGEVGCDLERRVPELADAATARRFFAAGEVRALAALPAELWREGFFNCWTRKEAYVKALGLGLSCPLDSFEVSVTPGAPAALLSATDGWSIHAFAPAPDHHAAIVARGDPAPASIRRFAPFPD